MTEQEERFSPEEKTDDADHIVHPHDDSRNSGSSTPTFGPTDSSRRRGGLLRNSGSSKATPTFGPRPTESTPTLGPRPTDSFQLPPPPTDEVAAGWVVDQALECHTTSSPPGEEEQVSLAAISDSLNPSQQRYLTNLLRLFYDGVLSMERENQRLRTEMSRVASENRALRAAAAGGATTVPRAVGGATGGSSAVQLRGPRAGTGGPDLREQTVFPKKTGSEDRDRGGPRLEEEEGRAMSCDPSR